MFNIQILNQSMLMSNVKLAQIIEALQIQVSRDFASVYNIDAKLTLTTQDNGDIPIYIVDTVADAPAGALAWHTVNDKGLPYGIIPMKIVLDDGENPSPTISHELLELLADPYCNTTKTAVYKDKKSLLAYEDCDPVESDAYIVHGIHVSNFVFPSWFVVGAKGPYDFMRKLTAPLSMTKGGYLQYEVGGAWNQVVDDDTKARKVCPHHHSRQARRLRKAASRV